MNVLEFVRGDGTDESVGLQIAINKAREFGELFFPIPPIAYATSRPLVISEPGLTLRGALCPRDTSNTGSRIIGLGAASLLNIRAGGVKILNLLLDGQNRTQWGILAQGAYRARIEDCLVKHCDGAGLFLGTAGNNNILCVRNSTFMQNGIGIHTVEAQDNNGLELFSVESSSNTSHGVQYSGQGLRVFGGIMNGNAGYGIQLSHPDDLGYTIGGAIFYPWLEGNLGGIRGGGKSVRNVAHLDWNVQDLTNAPGSQDLMLRATNSPVLALV